MRNSGPDDEALSKIEDLYRQGVTGMSTPVAEETEVVDESDQSALDAVAELYREGATRTSTPAPEGIAPARGTPDEAVLAQIKRLFENRTGHKE